MGISHITARDPAMARAHAMAGMPLLRRTAPGLRALIGILIGQQVSVASARAIEQKFDAAFPACTADALVQAEEAQYRAAGFSGPKIRAARAIGRAIGNGKLDIDQLGLIDADAAHRQLCGVTGIGPWTADIYLMFALGHADAFAAGDLALQEALRGIDQLEKRPAAAELLERAERWRPWRAVGARMLWQYYKVMRMRDGV